MHDTLSKFQEVARVLRENEQLHRRVGHLEVQNQQLSEDLRRVSLQLAWIATIVKEQPGPSGE